MNGLAELLSEAAVEISNLDGPLNPVVVRIRQAIKELADSIERDDDCEDGDA